MVTSRRLVIAASAVFGASGLVLFARRDFDYTALGDRAVVEIYTQLASTGHLLLGPYSRFQWHHPGPLYFFWMVPFYVLAGAKHAGLHAGALALNVMALAVLTTVVVRRAGAVLAVAILGTTAAFAWRAGPVLTSPWNPHIPLFAFMALIVAAADAASGAIATLPIVAALGSLVGQTHVGLLPSALLLGAIAAVGGIVSIRRHPRPDVTRILLVTAMVLVVLWLPSIVEQFIGRPGNISQLWTFFVTESHGGQRFATALGAWSDMMAGLARPDFVVARGLRFRPSPIRWTQAFAAIEVIALVTTAILAARARRGFECALATLLLLTSLLALWSATQIVETVFDHEVFWISVVGVLNIAVALSLAGGFFVDRFLPSFRTLGSSVAICWLLFSLSVLTGLRYLRADVVESPKTETEAVTASEVAEELRAYVTRERIVRPLIRIDQDAWPLAAGVILRLQKDGVPVAVEDDWIAMFTPAFARRGDEQVELTIDAKPQHVRTLGKPGDSVLFEHDPLLFVHRTASAAIR